MSKPDLTRYKDRMDKAVDALKDDFGGLRTGRANAGLLEPVMVEAYGSTMPLSGVGSISVPEPRLITVSVWDRALVIATEKAVDALKDEFAGLRTGRANAGLLEPVTVEAYGSTMPLSAVGSVSVPEPRLLTVSVWDKALVIPTEKAIRAAGLGLNPLTDGQTLRIPIPPLTEERRRDLAKLAGKYAEQQKVAVRNVRRDAMEDLKKAEKAGAASEDEAKKAGEEVQGFTDAAVKRIDDALKVKEQEIMQV